MTKKALILGVTGQDGSYCAELLIKKNYKVFGMIRKSATGNTKNIKHLLINKKIIGKKLFIEHGDLLDHVSIKNIIEKVKPDEIYNFADQDHVRWSFEIPIYSYNVTVNSVISILETLKNIKKKIKYFQPISSNIFGNIGNKKFNENSQINPQSIYALGKSSVFNLCKMYKQIYNIPIYGAIFFNHESPRRSPEYVTQKIIKEACEIYHKKKKKIYLGDIKAKIDWGYAKDYVFYSWKIMQSRNPDFFVIATGKTTSVKRFLDLVFKKLSLNYKNHLIIDKKLLRPTKTSVLTGDFSKAKKMVNYKVKTNINELIDIMLESQLRKYK
jgi:GDPmannose 4,6-dehydratase